MRKVSAMIGNRRGPFVVIALGLLASRRLTGITQ